MTSSLIPGQATHTLGCKLSIYPSMPSALWAEVSLEAGLLGSWLGQYW